jgi:hypothetical protein
MDPKAIATVVQAVKQLAGEGYFVQDVGTDNMALANMERVLKDVFDATTNREIEVISMKVLLLNMNWGAEDVTNQMAGNRKFFNSPVVDKIL